MKNNNYASQSTEARNSAIFTVSAYFASENIYKDMNITDDTFNEFYLSSNSLFTFICKALTSSKTYATFYITYGANRYEFSLSKDYYSGNYSINVLDWGNNTDGYEVTLSADIKRIGNKNVAVIAKAIISEIVRHYDAFNEALYMEENATINETPILNEAPTLEDTPMLEDDVVMVGYSVEGLAYVRENLEDVDVVSMLKESMGVLSNDPYTMESIMRGGVLDQEKFADALWDIVWEEHLCGLTDEALESETRYYTDFDALCLQLCGAVAAYNEVMRVVKNNADSVTYGAQGFSWDLFTEETMLTLMANNDLVDMLRKSLFAEVGCSDLLVYDDCLYLWYNNNSWETSIVTAA